ncbi:hypothetical protein K505DRAFT_307755 [Melanomma pulvis-pyrius CBS 109.77]|uniref:C2H2-type domain-containing protein n=1 Tax=Melanomma pulvis-pyrius CBS 109.77 TaxID=1314802 RepID=A0A6A6X962_9PLEO|nr:hypothetical protein K505DRAFT_307755 [Melanomma pulvis-pyrius CBS 109.77]
MSPIRLGSRDLLEYDARHGVLICRECQYAIQKSALGSHLLRHKIYRDERQHLLSSIAQLDLLEPDHVPLPNPASPPIDALPIIPGFRCAVVGCGNLCASSKRMRRHQSEIHGLREPSRSSSLAVKLQTFFRGTKLRYFEVTPLPTDGYIEEGSDEQMHDADIVTQLSPPQHVPKPPGTTPKSSLVDFDLQTLTYFHHFTTTASLTLPIAEHQHHSMHYWQTDVVLQALGQRWLMCGLLALSACHLAALADDTMLERVHRERSAQFFSDFSAGWEETKHELGVVATRIDGDDEANKAGEHIKGLLYCAHWALAESTFDQGTPSQLQSIMATIRGVVVSEFPLHHNGYQSGDSLGQEETFARASIILKAKSSSEAGVCGGFSSYDNTSSVLLDRLRALPSRMTKTFGRPESVQDVLATLSAIAALAESCDISFASDEAGAAWWGMAMWLIKIPDHFNHMVSCLSLAALVVLAHWASLVQRAEYCGCWFLRGLGAKILSLIAERLPVDNLAVRSLVDGLVA